MQKTDFNIQKNKDRVLAYLISQRNNEEFLELLDYLEFVFRSPADVNNSNLTYFNLGKLEMVKVLRILINKIEKKEKKNATE